MLVFFMVAGQYRPSCVNVGSALACPESQRETGGPLREGKHAISQLVLTLFARIFLVKRSNRNHTNVAIHKKARLENRTDWVHHKHRLICLINNDLLKVPIHVTLCVTLRTLTRMGVDWDST